MHTVLIPTITWVPKAARADFSRTFAELCHKVAANPESTSVWILLLMFVKVTLTAPTGKNKPDLNNQTKTIKNKLSRWRKGEYSKLWEEAARMTRSSPQSERRASDQEVSQEEMNALRAVRLAQQGEYTRAVQSLTSAGLAKLNRDTIRTMKSKHPTPSHASTFRSSQSSPQMIFSHSHSHEGHPVLPQGVSTRTRWPAC